MSSRNAVFGLVASVVTIAVALGLLLVVDGDDEIELPDRIGSLVALDDPGALGEVSEVSEANAERQRAAYDVNNQGYSDVFDGAAAGTRAYVDPADESFDIVSVIAVEADAGPLVPDAGFTDPESLGLALPLVERVTDGDVECLLFRSSPPRAGTDYQPDQATPDAISCQRRSGTLTVRARGSVGDTDAMVDLVDDLWDELA